MKKILSLTLAVLMVVSMIPTAFAAEAGGNWAGGTQVAANGSRTTTNDDGTTTHNVEYTITVPASLAPGGEGTVTLEGMWPSDATVKVTAETSVDMVNSISSGDKKTLVVTFPSIEKAGNNTQAVSASAKVSVADIEAALFGTWNGKFNYNVDYVAGSGNTSGGSTGGDSGTTVEPSDPDDGSTVEPGENQISFTIEGVSYLADEGMTWKQWIESDYNTCGVEAGLAVSTISLNGAYIYLNDENGKQNNNDTIIDNGNYIKMLITFTIAGTEYQAEDGTTWGEWVESEYNTDGKYAINENGRVVRTDTNTNPYVATVEYMIYQDESFKVQATEYKHMS